LALVTDIFFFCTEILEEFRVNAKLLGQIVTRLVSALRTAPSKLGLYAKQAASTIQNLITVARSAAKQPTNTETPKSKENLSEDAVIILKCCKLITTDPHDTGKHKFHVLLEIPHKQ
jgi:hypothetical protein